MGRFAVLLAFLAILVAGVGALVWRLTRPVEVSVAVVRRGPAVSTVFATGAVEARERRTLRPPRQAVIAEVFVKEWAEVRRGTPLLRLRDTAREVRRERARAELDLVEGNLRQGSAFRGAAQARIAEARENAAQAKREAERHRGLMEEGHIQRSAYEEMESRARALAEQVRQAETETEATLAEWESRRRKAQAELDTLAAQERDDVVTSPIDGIVLDVMAEEGELVGPERDVLKVGDVRDLVVECGVDEDDISRVRIGQEVLIRLAGSNGVAVHGKVFEVLPDADRGARSFEVRVQFDGARFVPDADGTGLRGRTELPGAFALYSGMSTELGIVIERRAGTLVFPRPALTTRGTVFAVENGRAVERTVVLGIRSFDACEVLEGLREGDVLISSGVAQIRPGMKVRAVEDAR
ncbi:MAG: efflux RND transporter periplasmic adaptor subunit [Candidatus Brocadiae bacterium]|nr:efflux RND transporter periplasmic adaptor subunit [Candidatus Brocadiia bacterium]